MGETSSPLIFTCSWQWLAGLGIERFTLARSRNECCLLGTIITSHEGEAIDARYQLSCDQEWRTQIATIELTKNGASRTLRISANNGHWLADGQDVAAVEGCIDIDLGWSPSTNMLPIRRLDLPVGGDSGVINAAWVKFPDLVIEMLPQRYERLASDLYRYSSRHGEFAARIRVDGQGVPIEYEGLWRRV